MKWLAALTCVLSLGFIVASAAGPEEVEKTLAAKDFWAKSGVKKEHADLAAATVEEVAEKTKNDVVRLRAAKILCDLSGKARYLPALKEADVAKAVEGTFRHLEANFNDKTVRNFRPELGLTHLSLTKKSDDAEGVWLLIEDTKVGEPSSGLNVRWDTKTGKVDKVDHWGVTR